MFFLEMKRFSLQVQLASDALGCNEGLNLNLVMCIVQNVCSSQYSVIVSSLLCLSCVQVNDTSTEGLRHAEVVALIKAGGTDTRLLVVDPETDELFNRLGIMPTSIHLKGTVRVFAWTVNEQNSSISVLGKSTEGNQTGKIIFKCFVFTYPRLTVFTSSCKTRLMLYANISIVQCTQKRALIHNQATCQ